MLKYKVGDVTNPEQTEGFTTVIVHCCNDIGVMGGGVALALAKKWPIVYDMYSEWSENNTYEDANGIAHEQPFVLGQIQLVKVDPNGETWVCNLIGQRDVCDYFGLPPVRYEAIREGLRRLANKLGRHSKIPPSQFNIAMPRMGAGLAGGSWVEIEVIIAEELKDFDVTIYDLEEQPKTIYNVSVNIVRTLDNCRIKYSGGKEHPAVQLKGV